MKYLIWLFKLAVFFTLFAFALNNQHIVSLYFFFGTLWQAPLVLVVLATFTLGLALGIALMLPHWLQRRRTVTVPPAVNAEVTATPPHHAV